MNLFKDPVKWFLLHLLGVPYAVKYKTYKVQYTTESEFSRYCKQASDLCQYFDAHQVHEADPCQVQDEGVEGHGLGLQCDCGGTGCLLVRGLLVQLSITTVEVDIAGGRFRFVVAPIVHVKVTLQIKLRCGLDLKEIQKERCTEKVTGCILIKSL